MLGWKGQFGVHILTGTKNAWDAAERHKRPNSWDSKKNIPEITYIVLLIPFYIHSENSREYSFKL